MKPILVLYVPVIHKGYIDLLEKYRSTVDAIYLIGDDIVAKISPYKEIRGFNSTQGHQVFQHDRDYQE